MTSVAVRPHPVSLHPVLTFADAVEAALEDVAGIDPVFMTTADKAEALLRLSRLADRLAAVRLRVVAVADDVAEADAARDVAAWLAHRLPGDLAACRADARLAQSLYGVAPARPVLGTAVAEGEVSIGQARVIARALDDLPDSVPTDVAARAETHLVEQTRDFAPRDLRILGRRVLDVVAPEVGDAEEARQLAAEEAHARAHTSLSLQPLGDGTTRITARVPDATASRLATYLHAYTSPRHGSGSELAADPTGPLTVERAPYGQRLGQAFCTLLEAVDPDRLPVHGGDATTVIVTMGLDQLSHDLATAGLSDGTRITASEARRLACTARILPAVLGGDSQPLDLGRSRRLFSPAQRKAMAIRDRQCRADGCTIPAAWSEAHHLTPWSLGGNTDLADGVLLCAHHHNRAHDPAYRTDRLPNGDLRYHRRT